MSVEVRESTIIFISKNPTELPSWTFVSDGGDVAVRVTMRSGQACEETELSPLSRRGGYKEIQSGHVLCRAANSYILTFDNSHSLIRSKTINYAFVVDLMEWSAALDTDDDSNSVTVCHVEPGLPENQVINGLRTGVNFTSTDLDPDIVINKSF